MEFAVLVSAARGKGVMAADSTTSLGCNLVLASSRSCQPSIVESVIDPKNVVIYNTTNLFTLFALDD
jgi:hypothetical protein